MWPHDQAPKSFDRILYEAFTAGALSTKPKQGTMSTLWWLNRRRAFEEWRFGQLPKPAERD